MNSKLEQLYQDIGLAAIAVADDLAGKILIYAEVEDGVVSADMFYVNQAGLVRFRFCPKFMKETVYSLWIHWKEQSENKEWRVICYVIEGSKFSIDLTYPDQIKKNEDVSERRPQAIRKYFDDLKVDYSKP
jgi:hypothetical protein